MIHIVPSCVDQPVYSWRSGLLWLEYWKLFIGNTKTIDHFNFFRITFSISFECTGGKHWGEDHFEIPSIHPTVLERGCQCQSCETIKYATRHWGRENSFCILYVLCFFSEICYFDFTFVLFQMPPPTPWIDKKCLLESDNHHSGEYKRERTLINSLWRFLME